MVVKRAHPTGPASNAQKSRQTVSKSQRSHGADVAKLTQAGNKRKFSNDRASSVHKKMGKFDAKKRHADANQTNVEKNDELSRQINLTMSKVLKKSQKAAERKEHVVELGVLLKGRMLEVAMRHDSARAVQALYRYSDDETRTAIITALHEKLLVLCKSNYSSFLVAALVQFGNASHRIIILKAVKGQLSKLSTHASGARVVDAIMKYCDDAGTVLGMRNRLWDELYGTEMLLHRAKEGHSAAASKEAAAAAELDGKSPADLLSRMELKSRGRVILAVGKLVKKQADKGMLRYAYSQKLMNEYLLACCKTAENAEKVNEDGDVVASETGTGLDAVRAMAPIVREATLAMASSQLGVDSVVLCIVHADAKERKKLLKALKQHVPALAIHDFAYRILIACFQFVDDTVQLHKSLATELFSAPDSLLATILNKETPGANRVLLHLVAPTSKQYLTVKDKEVLAMVSSTSNKADDKRQAELMKNVRPMIEAFVNSNVEKLAPHKLGTDLVVETFSAFKSETLGEKLLELATTAIAVADDEMEVDEEGKEPLDDPIMHMLVKKCVVADKASEVEGSSQVDEKNVGVFAKALADALEPRMAELAQGNRTAFVLLALAENPASAAVVKKALKGKQTALAKLKDLKGTQLLLKAIK